MLRISQLKCNGQPRIIQNLFVRQSTVAAVQTSESSGNDNQCIVIPKKINRSPTDLLYTLSKTVGRDPTSSHYKFHDDPYLTPVSYTMREKYALSQESGKRTAKWFVEQHSEYFNGKDAQPQIEAFMPKTIFTQDSEVNVKDLEKAIDTINVSDAITIYNLLVEKNITITDELKQSLLECLCFFNQENPLPFDMYEERAIAEFEKRNNPVHSPWKKSGVVDQVYNSIEPKTPAAYNAMIRGLYKYNQSEHASQLFIEANENQIPLDLATYNAHIRGFTHRHQPNDKRYDEILKILTELNEKQIKPNVHTLNACLETLKFNKNITYLQMQTSQIMGEFLALNIEPSLETYIYLLDIYHGKQTVDGTFLNDIVDRLERNPNLVAHSKNDLTFFTKAMNVCRFRMKNCGSLARRIDNIVTHSDNIKFLGNSYHESLYYRDLLHTILKNETFTEFINVYDQLVPETHGIDVSLAEEVFNNINLNGLIQHIPKFWQHIKLSGVVRNAKLHDIVLAVMESNRLVDGVEEHTALSEEFSNIAWDIYRQSTGNELAERYNKDLIPAKRLANIIILLLRAKNHHNATIVVDQCLEEDKDNRIIGHLTDNSLQLYLDSCIVQKEPNKAIKCLAYAVEHGVGDQIEYGRKIIKSFTLDSKQIKKITNLVGNDALKSVENPEQASKE
ncbi:protein PTCD3 homolog, mitochondrial [Contarinia nasturtii]|uniref:protein PTCD3 homolog, mitochondrial n=1 Tax=Contarinia nasturtii TaxID=265458 RepID=UPI0012D37F18|nr:protein PTCD3 homolog, mitochondrial [Contarinia nasturtii]